MNCEAIHCFDTATVRFAIYPDGFDGARIIAQISEDALRDLFGARGGGQSLVDACQAHFGMIEALALAHYHRTPDQAIVLKTRDFGKLHGQPVDVIAIDTHADSQPAVLVPRASTREADAAIG